MEFEPNNYTKPFIEILKIHFDDSENDTINNAIEFCYWKLWELNPDKMKKATDEYHNRP
jgi:hypothetical protein